MRAALLGMLVLANGCGRLADWGTPTWQGSTFPHPQGWEEAAGHGAVYLARGAARCVGCHEVEPGNEFCGECHDSYPHGEDWLAGERHGAGTFGKWGELQPCLDCHALEGAAASALACESCHASYPHPKGWEGAGQHGSWLVERAGVSLACTPCHGQDFEGGRVSEACSSCHASYPHPDGWEEGAEHGHFEDSELRRAGCVRCHGGLEGGTAELACARCHASYPHAHGWRLGHAAEAGRFGELPCLTCHGAGDGSDAMPASCAPSCHGGGA